MDEIKALAESIEEEKIERARKMSPYEKLMAGPALFEDVCHWMRVGIRNQFPDADDKKVEEILVARLALAKQEKGEP